MDRTYISDDDNLEDFAVQELGGVTHYVKRNSSALTARDPADIPSDAGIPVISEDTKVRLAIRTSQACVPGAYVSNEALRPKPSQRQIAEIGLMRERQKNRAYVDDEPHRPIPAPVSEEEPIEDLQGRMHNLQKEANLKDDIENMQLKKAKRKRHTIIGVVVIIFLILAIAVGVGVGLSTSRKSGDNGPSTATETLVFDECYTSVNDDRSTRFMELRSIVISGYPDVAVAVDTVGGTARAAMCWLTHVDRYGVQAVEGSEVQVVQRFALACIYYSLAGAANEDTEKRLTLMSNWLSSRSVCEWDYVGCSQNDKTVTELHLEDLSLERPHLQELPLLSNLALLDLTNNAIFGQIPSGVFSLSKLTELRLEINPLNVEIAPELASLSQLQVLTFGDNFLSGTIPSHLFELSQLRKLHLGRNRLRGTIPDELNHASSLVELHIDSNQLTGTIPDLRNLSELSSLKIYYNSFDGTFPDISGCTNLGKLSKHPSHSFVIGID